MGLILRTTSVPNAGTTVSVKGAELTFAEGDGNFAYLLTNMSGSNISITGSTSISGSLTVTNQITAQTLVVQTITSSVIYSSGSNIFGNNISNTQQFTGSVSITGSLSLNGNNAVVGSGSVNYLPKFTGTSTLGNSLIYESSGIINAGGQINITSGQALTLGLQVLQLPTGVANTISAGLSVRTGVANESIIQLGNNLNAYYTGLVDSSRAGAMIRIDTRGVAPIPGASAYSVFQIQTRAAGVADPSYTVPVQIAAAPHGSFCIDINGYGYFYNRLRVGNTTSAPTEALSVTGNGSFSGNVTATSGFTGSLEGTSSFAITASYALNANPPFPYTGSAVITGSLVVTGSVTATSVIETSTRILKNNIQPYITEVASFNLLQPVSYNWKDTNLPDVGLIAEDVNEIFPEFVAKENGEITGINYSKLSILFINMLKQHQQQIDELKQEINILKNK